MIEGFCLLVQDWDREGRTWKHQREKTNRGHLGNKSLFTKFKEQKDPFLITEISDEFNEQKRSIFNNKFQKNNTHIQPNTIASENAE